MTIGAARRLVVPRGNRAEHFVKIAVRMNGHDQIGSRSEGGGLAGFFFKLRVARGNCLFRQRPTAFRVQRDKRDLAALGFCGNEHFREIGRQSGPESARLKATVKAANISNIKETAIGLRRIPNQTSRRQERGRLRTGRWSR